MEKASESREAPVRRQWRRTGGGHQNGFEKTRKTKKKTNEQQRKNAKKATVSKANYRKEKVNKNTQKSKQ